MGSNFKRYDNLPDLVHDFIFLSGCGGPGIGNCRELASIDSRTPPQSKWAWAQVGPGRKRAQNAKPFRGLLPLLVLIEACKIDMVR